VVASIMSTTSFMNPEKKNHLNMVNFKFPLPILLYSNSKAANILFTIELARRLKGTNITVNCLHPGLDIVLHLGFNFTKF
jgi:NAD(P)-dependent dehydrogenase (short-subunit alcohol dehydrogenase family)